MWGSIALLLRIEQVFDRLAPLGIGLARDLQINRVPALLADRLLSLWRAALWTAIGKARLVRLQLELLFAHYANFDWK